MSLLALISEGKSALQGLIHKGLAYVKYPLFLFQILPVTGQRSLAVGNCPTLARVSGGRIDGMSFWFLDGNQKMGAVCMETNNGCYLNPTECSGRTDFDTQRPVKPIESQQ
jgi:hypothetical protein